MKMYLPTQVCGGPRLVVGRRASRGVRGLGDETPAQIVGTVSSIGTPVALGVTSAAASSAAAAAGTTASILGMSMAVAIPVIGAALAGITIGIEALLNSGCGQTCIETSQWANQAAALLEQNVQAYMALATPRPYLAQQAAEANFNNIWNKLVQMCSQPGLGTAGQNCIADRQRGACKWKVTSGPDAGQCFDWFMAYYDPIATDTNVAPASVATQAASTATTTADALSSATGIPTWMLAVAGLAILFLVVKP
jgi:hypothetical protein